MQNQINRRLTRFPVSVANKFVESDTILFAYLTDVFSDSDTILVFGRPYDDMTAYKTVNDDNFLGIANKNGRLITPMDFNLGLMYTLEMEYAFVRDDNFVELGIKTCARNMELRCGVEVLYFSDDSLMIDSWSKLYFITYPKVSKFEKSK